MASRSASRTVRLTVLPVHSGSASTAGAGGDGGGAASDFGVSRASAGAVAAGFGAGALASGGGAAAVTSSPSPASSAIGVLTATFSVPSGTRILASVPSSTASTSMVALSVSISAMMSPALTVSPSALDHFASLPSVMVGESAGILISMVTCPASRSGVDQHVGPQLRRVRLRTLLGELGRRRHRFLDRLVDRLQRCVVGEAAVDQALAHKIDRVVLRAHLLHLFLRAVLGRNRHRMAAIAVGH